MRATSSRLKVRGRPWTGVGQTGAPGHSHPPRCLSAPSIPALPLPTPLDCLPCPSPALRDIQRQELRSPSPVLSLTAPSQDSGLWPPLARAVTQPQPLHSPPWRGQVEGRLDPEEGTHPGSAPGLPRASLTVERTPPVPLPGCLPQQSAPAWTS